MNKGMKSIAVFTKFGLAILGILLCMMIVAGADNLLPVPVQIANYGWKLDAAFYLVYIAGAICLAVVLLFAVLHVVQNPKSLIGFGLFAIVMLLSYYVFSGNEVIKDFYPDETTPETSQFVGGGLIALYIVGLGSIAAIVYAEVSKLLK
jgi:predicted neutral ceramidase superfamily lipid hydrolase